MGAPKFAHVVLQTSRFTQMRDWYCTALGGHVVFQNDLLCFITFDEEHHRIALLNPPGKLDDRSPKAAGMNHTAYTFASLDDLFERFTELKKAGITPRQPIQHGVTTSLYYQDPDGNFVEMQVDNFATPDDATKYMCGAEYAADPVGVPFSPEKMLEAHRVGVPFEVLKTRTWALEACPGLPDPLIALTS